MRNRRFQLDDLWSLGHRRGLRSPHGDRLARVTRQPDREDGTAADAAFNDDAAAVHLDDRVDDREAEATPRAARLGRLRSAVEALEDVGQLRGVDPDSGVGHDDAGAVAMLPNLDRDAPAAGRELDAVRDEVRDDLADPN